jgi:hypothetical protein
MYRAAGDTCWLTESYSEQLINLHCTTLTQQGTPSRR